MASNWKPPQDALVLKDLSQLPKAGASTASVAPAASYFYQYFQNNDGGQCLDGDSYSIPANGARVQLWACTGSTNQGWTLTQVAGWPYGFYLIQNNDGGQCLDGDRNTIPADGARVQLWACATSSIDPRATNQIWKWNGSQFWNADGYQCLDGDRNTIPANGSKVQLWACNGYTNQGWSLDN